MDIEIKAPVESTFLEGRVMNSIKEIPNIFKDTYEKLSIFRTCTLNCSLIMGRFIAEAINAYQIHNNSLDDLFLNGTKSVGIVLIAYGLKDLGDTLRKKI